MVIRKFKLYCLVIRFSHFSIENITIIEIRQTARSREIFAQGALAAAKVMARVDAPGLYDMSMLVT